MNKDDKIYVAGHCGLVGSAIVRALERQGYTNLLLRMHSQLDLLDRTSVARFFESEQPRYVFLAAAHVGGILINQSCPVHFLQQNLRIQDNVIEASYRTGVERLLFLGSSCIYPRDCPQPIREEYLLSGPLERSNRPYALAKITGIEQCWAYNRQFGTSFIALMPCNLYGPGDNYDLKSSHVLPALLRKMVRARLLHRNECTIWGTGTPKREFLISDDCAQASMFVMNLAQEEFARLLSEDRPPILNVGSGEEVTILALARMVARITGFEGHIRLDSMRPDGTRRKLLDCTRMRELGWSPSVGLYEGVSKTFAEARETLESLSTPGE